MFFATELPATRVHISRHPQGVFGRPREIYVLAILPCAARMLCPCIAKAPLHRQLGLLYGQHVLIVDCIV